MTMKKIILTCFLMSAKLTFGQTNGGFELWDTVYTNAYSVELADSFGVPNPLGGIVNSWTASSGYGVSRTTDSYSGNYSLILHNWYTYAQETISYHNAISYTPQYLQGYYKYNTHGSNGLSQGKATVTLTSFNGTFNDTIATGTYLFDSSDVFIPFQLNIGLTSLIADSVSISIINADNSNSCVNNICNLLYLDNLTLTNIPLGIENSISNENVVSVFPNPSNSELNIQINSTQVFKFTLYNSLGEKIIDTILANRKTTIDLSAYSNDIYFYKLTSADKNLIKSGKLIKQ